MDQSLWIKQSEKAAFPDLLWARPEVKSAAGKLLIVGGNTQSFAVLAEAYVAAERAGIGVARVVLPDSLQRTVGKLFPAAVFAPSNPSGGFATQALTELLMEAQWSDGVLLAGDLGRNSESLAMLENFAGKYEGPLTIAKDAADFFCTQPQGIAHRQDTLLVINMGQLQKLGTSLHRSSAFTSELGLLPLAEQLHTLTTEYPNLYIVTSHQQHIAVTVHGLVATSPATDHKFLWQTDVSAASATWWLQNPTKPFEALTTAVLEPS